MTVLERIAAGDQSAVKEFFDAYGNLVWALARRLSGSAADAEDAAQEIFVEVWKSASRFDPDVAPEAVFITTIARRRLIDRLRARRRRPVTEQFDEEVTAEHHQHAGGDAGAIAADVSIASRALEQLGEAQREILLLGIVDGLTHSEIAIATGKPLGTVKTQMRRGLLKIRELLGTDDSASETTE